MKKAIELGVLAKDVVSGFEGVVTIRCEYLYGSPRCQLTSKYMKDGKPVECWMDEGQVEVVEDLQ